MTTGPNTTGQNPSGTMQDWPLLVWKLIDHAALNHGDREIVSLTCEGYEVRTTWRHVQGRAKQVAGRPRRRRRHDRLS